MHIGKIEVKNFRLLRDVSLSLEAPTTVIVGRNNSGKTSLAELFHRLSDVRPSFRLEDFSLSVHGAFRTAYALKQAGADETDVREVLPFIEVRLTVVYEANTPSLGPVSDFIIDLNSDCTEALILVRYQLAEGHTDVFFADIDPEAAGDQRTSEFYRIMRDRVPKHYAASVVAIDPNDETNQKAVDLADLRSLLNLGFIDAQRGLDDVTRRDNAVLSRILEALFTAATSGSDDSEEHMIVQRLEEAVESTRESIDSAFNEQLIRLLPAFSEFGYPGLADPQLCTETSLDVQRLLSGHTQIQYAGASGVNLPEGYNGLGVRNLIYILLRLFEFFKSFAAEQAEPGVQLVFIEEPEVHLHPQMQEVFISKLNGIADVFARVSPGGLAWPVQFVVTTHSSHVANRAPFDSIRYFLATPDPDDTRVCRTKVKDLGAGFGGVPEEDRAFLHKYMTLTRCDLLFADKAALIEGTAERLLLPTMIEKVESASPGALRLSSQYVSIVEVGGAYAHRFFGLLDFLELRTLIITDLDAVRMGDGNRLVKCKVSEGSHTSNGCIKSWFRSDGEIKCADLIQKSDEDKTQGIRRLAYQVPETDGAPCGRSFEDAFILANPDLFGLRDGDDHDGEAYEKAQEFRKSDFALRYAVDSTTWTVPRYIADGLRWLAEGDRCPIAAPSPVPTDVAGETSPRPEMRPDG